MLAVQILNRIGSVFTVGRYEMNEIVLDKIQQDLCFECQFQLIRKCQTMNQQETSCLVHLQSW